MQIASLVNSVYIKTMFLGYLLLFCKLNLRALMPLALDIINGYGVQALELNLAFKKIFQFFQALELNLTFKMISQFFLLE